MEIETFPALNQAGLRHGFSTRSAGALDGLEADLQSSFRQAGFPLENAVQGEQTHGNRVAVIDGSAPKRIPEVDALATNLALTPLIIRVADCGPVFFFDPATRSIAVAHSGRKGTEGNIVGATISRMQAAFGTHPEDLILTLGPCIRPPHYEVDFAGTIAQQAREEGVRSFHDSGICTACDLNRYYSYRAEKGKTGRMWAVLMLE